MSEQQPLSYTLDPTISLSLVDPGNFYEMRIKVDKNGIAVRTDRLLLSIPLKIQGLVKQGDKWKIRYTFDATDRLDTIDAMLQFVSNKAKTDRKTLNLFAEFLYKFKAEKEVNGDFSIQSEAITVKDGIVHVNKTSDQDAGEILATLGRIYEISTFPNAFLISLCYCTIAPFSYEIRSQGEKFPYRLLSGRTHGGKTTDQRLIALRGFDQSLKEREETMNTVKTIFTLGLKIEESALPFLADDINNDWLNRHAEELKGASDKVKFQVRGTKTQERLTYDMLGMPIFTMNAVSQVPLALNDRMIISRYTEDHEKRQNKKDYEQLSDLLKPGFMLKLVKESLEGTSVNDIIKAVHKSCQKDQEISQKLISYAFSLLHALALKHGVKFPEKEPVIETQEEDDLLDRFLDYIAVALAPTNRDQQTNRAKFCENLAKGIIITNLEGVLDFVKKHNLRNINTLTDLMNELKSEQLKYQSIWSPCVGKTTRAIVIPREMVVQREIDLENETDEPKPPSPEEGKDIYGLDT